MRRKGEIKMAFFENLSEVLSSKGKEAAEVAKKVAESANLKSQLSGVNAEIRKHYMKIGEAYFESYKDCEVDCEFEENVQAIRDAKKAIAELEKRLRELKGNIKCESCGSLIDAECCFCPKCGAKVEVEFFDEDDDIEEVDAQIIEETRVEEETQEEEPEVQKGTFSF